MVSNISFTDSLKSANLKKKKSLNFKNSNTLSYPRTMYTPSQTAQQKAASMPQVQEKKGGINDLINIGTKSSPIEEIILGAGVLGTGIAKRKSIAKLFTGKETEEVKNTVQKKSGEIKENIKENGVINTIKEEVSKLTEQLKGVQENIDNVQGKATRAIDKADSANVKADRALDPSHATGLIHKSTVKVNGANFHLADTISKISGPAKESMEKELQTNAAKCVLGRKFAPKLTEGEAFVRIPTAEIIPFTKEGGQAVVPKEVAENMLAMINENDKVKFVIDTPLYTGRIKQDNQFYKLVQDGEKFKYVKQESKDGKVNETITSLEKIDEFELPIITDKQETLEKVRLFRAKKQGELDYNLAERFFNPKFKEKINQASQKHYNEFQKNLKTEDIQLEHLTSNDFEILGTTTDDLKKLGIKLKEDDKVRNIKSNLIIKKIHETLIENFKGKGIDTENIKTKDLQIKDLRTIGIKVKDVDYKELETLPYKIYEDNNFIVKKNISNNKKHLHVKLDYVLHDNRKFNLDIPLSQNGGLYNNNAISAGETERFTYLSKYLYEHSAKMQSNYEGARIKDKEGKTVLRTDAIMGNDWHPGPAAAMFRQLTTAKEAYGQLNKQDAKKLKEIPIVSIMHNATYNGGVWHSQEKLLNVMYGEHAANVVKNSHAPNLSLNNKGGLEFKLHNPHVVGAGDEVGNVGFFPQSMAVNYSDVVIPVSKNYSSEIATDSGFGGEMQPIFKVRKRIYEYSDKKNIDSIAKNNGLDPKTITEEPTQKGVTNGCEKLSQTFTPTKARQLEHDLGLKDYSLKAYPGLDKSNQEYLDWTMHNKKTIVDQILVPQINQAYKTAGKENPMKIADPSNTNLEGVTENTPIFSTAGRIVDQKGFDIYAGAVKEYFANHHKAGDEIPVFYAQGNGDKGIIKQFMDVKTEIAKTNKKASERMVFADLFSEAGRYDSVKLFSDFSIMSSWFEPCGLVHKELASYGAVIPIVNKTGGLTEGLTDGVDAIFSNFTPRHTDENAKEINSKSFAKAMKKGVDLFNDKERFAEGLKKTIENDFSWMAPDGAGEKYYKIFQDLGVVKADKKA